MNIMSIDVTVTNSILKIFRSRIYIETITVRHVHKIIFCGGFKGSYISIFVQLELLIIQNYYDFGGRGGVKPLPPTLSTRLITA